MNERHILITGAASGMGRGLAVALARAGAVLHLTDRHGEALGETARLCMARGAEVRASVMDVRDREAMAEWVGDPSVPRVDLVFACAGVTGSCGPMDREGAAFEDPVQVQEMFDVNLDGALNTILPALTRMRGQSRDRRGRRGRICAIASVAGLVSYPATASYCASKAALDRFVVATGAYARRAGIGMSSVCCSFVDTPMVASNHFPMPGLVSTEFAVRAILRGVARGRRRIIFPSWLVLGSRFMDFLPIRLAELYYLHQSTGRPGSMSSEDDRIMT